jgi:DUF4097 and DUF4098 domain-containing protein YvlB
MLRYVFVLAPVFASVGCIPHEGGERINGAVSVAAGQPAANASTVNGAVHIAADAVVKEASTVNGSITLGDRAMADSASTVNGSIQVGAGARVGGDVSTVNGAITLQKGVDVKGGLENVNGQITLDAARVGGGIETVQGDVTVGADSRVDGGITVEKSTGISLSFSDKVPVIVVGPGASVRGPLRFEREVKLYVSDRATIGAVTGATPIPFAGDKPPG